MNQLKAFLAIVVILCVAGAVQARTAAKYYGTQGTISKLGSRGFLLTIKADQVVEVVCDNNTKFMRDGNPVDPSEVKEGLKVGVIGASYSPTRMQAQTVNLLGPAPKAKSK